VASGVGIDTPGLGTMIQNVGHWARARLLHRNAGVMQVVDEKIEMHVLLSVLARPHRRSIARHTVEGEAPDGLPAEGQPIGVAFGLGQVEDLLPEPGQFARGRRTLG
jgi:hypothetical protein